MLRFGGRRTPGAPPGPRGPPRPPPLKVDGGGRCWCLGVWPKGLPVVPVFVSEGGAIGGEDEQECFASVEREDDKDDGDDLKDFGAERAGELGELVSGQRKVMILCVFTSGSSALQRITILRFNLCASHAKL